MSCGRTGSIPVQSNLCLTCSNTRVTLEVASVVLKLQGFVNSAEERQTILQVICQLLRVQWESVAEVMTLNDGMSHFCATCFKVITTIILLREKMFKIEDEIRNELKKIEDSVTITWAEGGHSLQGTVSFLEICPPLRTTFQRQVMEEVWNKKLLQQKVAELHETSNNFPIDLKPSMVQLNFTKNVFEIKKEKELIEMSSEEKEEVDIRSMKIDLDYDDSDEMPPVLELQSSTSPASGSYHEPHVEFTLTSVSPDLADSDSNEPCPRKKAKGDDIVTTLTSNPIQDVSNNEDNDISSMSQGTRTIRDLFVLPYTMVKSNAPDKSFVKACLWKPGSVEPSLVKADLRKSTLPKTRTKRLSRDMKIKNVNTKVAPRNSPTISNSNEINCDDEEDDDGNKDEDWIDENERMLEDSDGTSDDSDVSIDETLEKEIDVDTETTDDQQDLNEEEPTGLPEPNDVSDSELGGIKQRFNPKRRFHPNSQKVADYSYTTLDQVETTFTAKDKTIWTTNPPNKTRKVRGYELLREKGGLIGPAKNTKLTPVEIFKLMFPPSIVETIVKYTNAQAEHVEKTMSSPKRVKWNPVTVEEIYAYIGILLYLGVEKKRNFDVHEAWSIEDRYSIPSVVATMSRDRFRRIQNHFRFDDAVGRKASAKFRNSTNSSEVKRSYISELLDPFVEVMQSHLSPYDTLVLDEMLVKFRGHSKFRVYMKSKPGKYGMKFWAVCDVETGYILNISLYQGKTGDTVAKELGKTVVLDLVKKYFNSGRAVTMDNFFTSKALGEELMKHKMSMLGTLNRNRMDVIPEFVDPKKREIQSSIIAFQGNFTMVSYIQRKNRAAVLLSTQHHSAKICPERKYKPQMILDYNATKGGVDTADQMIAHHTCQRTTRRWPVKVFYALLDIAALNAYIVHQIHSSSDEKKVLLNRIHFLRSVSEALMEPLITTRLDKFPNFHVPGHVYRALVRLGYERKPGRIPNDVIESGRLAGHGRCNICEPPVKNRKKSQTKCDECRRFVCSAHHKIIRCCPECESVLIPSHLKHLIGYKR